MSKTMLVNVTHVEESRVAVLDNGVLEAYEIETLNRTQIKGNIHNAVVENVHPSLEAAFLRIGPDLKGFLPLDEVNFKLLPSRGESRKAGRIGQHLHPGQKIMAQVVREPFSGKPPTVSTYFSLPGRYLVLMPGVDSSGVSRKIDDSKQRDRLKKIVKELNPPEGFGVIVRTAGIGQTKAELQRDMKYLLRLWQSIQRASQATEFPGLVYREADLVIRTIRDHLNTDIAEVWIDNKETYDKALAFVRDVMPNRAKTLRLYNGDRPLFNKHNLEEQIESIYKRRVTLPSGGEIVIDGTEALTAIDVNSARSKRKGDAEDTALQTNLEAAPEIARQLRLRDLGGLVVIDFIDMLGARNKKKVEEAIRDAMRGDRAKHDITRISKMGLVEIARQRLRGAKMGAMYTSCPTCEGYGLIKNLEAAALAALRKLQTRSARSGIGKIRVRLPPDVASWMLNHKRDDLARTERQQQIQVVVEPIDEMLRHESDFETFAREKAPEPTARVVGDRMPPPPPPENPPPPEPQAAEAETGDAGPAAKADESAQTEAAAPRRRRRRRRRGGSGGGDQAAEAGDSSGSADESSSKLLPFASDEAEAKGDPTAETGHDGGEGAEGSAAAAEGENVPAKPRRRRRRRRRSRSSSEPGGETSAGETSAGGESAGEKSAGKKATGKAGPAAAGETEGEVVPKGVRADELVAAAVPSRGRRGSGSGGRRRRRSSS